jgi:membrane-bound lytic murein transglycosylase B
MKRIAIGIVAFSLAGCMCGKTATPPPQPAPAAAEESSSNRKIIIRSAPPSVRSQTIMNRIVAGEFADVPADFNATMKQALPPEKLRQVWSQLTAQFGAFKSMDEPTETTEQGYRVVWIPLTFERGVLRAKFAYDDTNYVAGLFFLP